jgi:putative nucleotidyltransferase with HDIG domain
MSLRPRSKARRWATVAISSGASAAAAGALVSWLLMRRTTVSTPTVAIFVLFVLVGELLEIPLERRAPFSLALAPAIAFALLRTCPAGGDACSNLVSPHVGEVVFVFVLGTTGATIIRAVRRNDLHLERLARGTLVLVGGAAVYRGVLELAPMAFTFGPSKMSALGMAALLATVLALHVGFEAWIEVATEPRLLWRSIRDNARVTAPLLLSTVSVGALLALAFRSLGAWTFPLFLAPLAATQFSFRQVSSIRRNYLQTIGALSRVPEMAGYTVRGHSMRVAQLSVEIASELGIRDPELHEIEYTALLHDIGRVSLPDPGDAARSTSQMELALVGAEIVENTGHFPRVAQMMRQQHEPYRRRGEDASRTLTLGAKIIKVASAYDDLTEPGGPGRTPRDAIDRLYLGMAYDYDPQVIQSLNGVLERRGQI